MTSSTSNNLKVIGVIPSRFASTRFPGKPLKLIAGKALITHVIEGAKQCKKLSEIIVATDHEEIAALARKSGVEVVMTDPDLPSGSDRVWAAVQNKDFDVVLNIQGDEPLIYGEPLDSLADAFQDASVQMATLAKPFQNHEDFLSQNIAKIVLTRDHNAMYFSRLPIPHTRNTPGEAGGYACVKHIGLYGYRKAFLKTFCAQAPTAIENGEALEQLRALWMGQPIRVILTKFESWGVDTPQDVLKVEEILAKRSR